MTNASRFCRVHGTIQAFFPADADCDWQYQQSDCVPDARFNNTCRMASPGYPGLYPPNRTCRYRVSLQSPFQPLTIKFLSVQLPPKYVTNAYPRKNPTSTVFRAGDADRTTSASS